MFRKRGYNIKNFRFSLLIVICMLSSIGLVVLRSLTVNQNQTMFKKQLLGVAAGLFILLIVSLFDYHWIGKLCIPLYIFNILLMLFCKFVDRSMSPKLYGKSVDQARRWIHIGNPNGGLDIMPSRLSPDAMTLAPLPDNASRNMRFTICASSGSI